MSEGSVYGRRYNKRIYGSVYERKIPFEKALADLSLKTGNWPAF